MKLANMASVELEEGDVVRRRDGTVVWGICLRGPPVECLNVYRINAGQVCDRYFADGDHSGLTAATLGQVIWNQRLLLGNVFLRKDFDQEWELVSLDELEEENLRRVREVAQKAERAVKAAIASAKRREWGWERDQSSIFLADAYPSEKGEPDRGRAEEPKSPV